VLLVAAVAAQAHLQASALEVLHQAGLSSQARLKVAHMGKSANLAGMAYRQEPF
jgi:hypothetical protein